MAQITEKTFALKNNQVLTLRTATPDDAQALLDHIDAITADGEGMSLSPGEFLLGFKEEVEHLQKMIDNPKSIFLVATIEGEIIANLDFNIGHRKRTAHHGWFGIAILPPWRGLGIGHILLTEMIAWAKNTPGIEKIKLNVLANNPRAIALYKKHGFEQTGTGHNEVKFSETKYVDDHAMELKLTGP
mgnify:CR=1 FL=1